MTSAVATMATSPNKKKKRMAHASPMKAMKAEKVVKKVSPAKAMKRKAASDGADPPKKVHKTKTNDEDPPPSTDNIKEFRRWEPPGGLQVKKAKLFKQWQEKTGDKQSALAAFEPEDFYVEPSSTIVE